MRKESFFIKKSTINIDSILVVLEGQLTIRNAGLIKTELLKVLTDSQKKLKLVLENVTKIDIAFFQLLIALQKSAVILNKEVSLDVGTDNKLKSAIKNSGLEKPLFAVFEA